MSDRASRRRGRGRPGPLASVLVATDFSPGADAALERAASLPLARGATVHVVHVLPAHLPRKVRDRAEPDARRLLEERAAIAAAAARRAGNAQLEIDPILARGQAYVEIIRQARAREVSLIAIGAHGRRPLRDLFLGSTAERVARMGDLPVLVVKARTTGPYRRTIAAIDLTDASRRVVDLALRLLDPGADRLRLVHAYHVPFEHWLTAADRREWRDRASRALEHLVAELGTEGVHLRPILRAGRPESVLLQEVARLDAELVAMGTHARSGLAHTLLGSVVGRVLRDVPCDVVVARPARFTFEPP